MVDDLLTEGIISADDAPSTDGEFDPDAFESDDILDDAKDVMLNDDLALGGAEDEIDPLLEEII